MAKWNKMRNYTISMCVCPECERSFPIPRMTKRNRELNHQKDIYCVFCDKKITMTEFRNADYYRNGLGERIVA